MQTVIAMVSGASPACLTLRSVFSCFQFFSDFDSIKTRYDNSFNWYLILEIKLPIVVVIEMYLPWTFPSPHLPDWRVYSLKIQGRYVKKAIKPHDDISRLLDKMKYIKFNTLYNKYSKFTNQYISLYRASHKVNLHTLPLSIDQC